MPRMGSRGCTEVSGRTLLGTRAVGGCTFGCEFFLERFSQTVGPASLTWVWFVR